MASFDVLDICGATLSRNRPQWTVFSGTKGDVGEVDWSVYANIVDVLHGGPPCQPFSVAGKQNGAADDRDMWPAFTRAVLSVRPQAFVAENVPGLLVSCVINKCGFSAQEKGCGEARPAGNTWPYFLRGTRAKHQKLMQVTGACIWVWNRMLAWNEEEYAWHERIPWVLPKPSTRFESTGKVFTQLRAETDWLQVLPFGAVRHALKDQALAWERYFKHQAGRPKYKSKYRTRTVTFPEPGHFKLAGKHIRLQKLG